MYYYTFSALVFANGNIRDAYNLVYSSEKPATIIEFRSHVAAFYAGNPNSYSGIIIVQWQQIDEATFQHLEKGIAIVNGVV